MKQKYLRIILLYFAAAILIIPITIANITGNSFSEPVSHLLISLSTLSCIGVTLLGLDRSNRNEFFLKIGTAIGLLIVLISIWL